MVVLNQSAWTIFTQFHQPAPLNSVAAMGGSAREVAKRMVELGILQPAGQPLVTERALSETLTVWLHVTNECNLRCDYCFVSKTPDEMDFERGKQAIDAVARSAVRNGFRRIKLKYAGGEATLNFPLVVALHQYAGDLAARHGLKLEGIVLSNGVAIGSRVIRALRASGIRLMISLDGIGEHHDTHRRFANGHGSFSRVARALDRLAQHGIKPSISITLSRRNLSGLAATVEYLLERELPFTINFYRENDCSASFSDLAYHDEQIIASMREAFAVIARRLPPYSLLGALLDRARLDTPHDYPCGVGRSYMVIDHHGGVAKCHMEIERTVTSVVVEDPLRLIREDREGVQNPAVAEKAGCRECAWRYWCAGGCPLLTYRVTGRYDVKSPNCRIYQTLFPEVVRLEGLRLLKYSGLAGG
ncbi:radical SAM/SPASM domain-containing protein [Chloroflexus sp.]|uniref:radical SAM/SPASM domain-containing protein n=1 Tax=Chloroflexus sp. TaxID=1904827 RepID=UPI0026370401|nr:radical SAM protein [uncultured Chloroflexus sp.]